MAKIVSQINSDIQSETDVQLMPIDWVGMDEIQSQIMISPQVFVPVLIGTFVNLKKGYRGIHMSRLYNLITQKILNQNLTTKKIQNFLTDMIQSQEQLSEQGYICFNFNYPRKTQSLKSESVGFRSYPVQIIALKKTNQTHVWCDFEIIYSSTCPQSAALSLEVIKNQKNQIERLGRLPATPHAQRSVMKISCLLAVSELDSDFSDVFQKFIEAIENTLKTTVQTAVKKADEMQFAILNSENLMFCEDAVRKVSSVMNELIQASFLGLNGYKIRTHHLESLHPHNAVSQIAKNYVNQPS